MINSVFNYMMADTSQALVKKASADIRENSQESGESEEMAKSIINTLSTLSNPAKVRQTAIFHFVSCLFTLAGAILMLRQRRTGYYLYILGICIYMAGPLIAYGFSNMFSIVSIIWQGFFGLLFIILYGMNVKYMR